MVGEFLSQYNSHSLFMTSVSYNQMSKNTKWKNPPDTQLTKFKLTPLE